MMRKRLLMVTAAAVVCGVWGCDLVSGPAPSPFDSDKTPRSGASIAIEAVQGTPDGPSVRGDAVTVELFLPGGKTETIHTKLDDHGVVLVEDLSLTEPFQPRVTVVHAGASYEVVGEVMDPAHPHQKITVTVYELTDEKPDWQISMLHMTVYPTPHAVIVQIVMIASNPADRAWLSPADAEGDRTSVAINLPPGAEEIQMTAGFHECCSKVVDGRLFSTRPLAPGNSRFDLRYRLPATDNQANVEIVAPAPVKNMIVFVPDDQTHVHTDDLTAADRVYEVGDKMMRGFKAVDLPAGKQIAMTITNLPEPRAHKDRVIDRSLKRARILAAVGGGVMLILTVLVLLIKPAGKAGPDINPAQ
ncbi:MAG TPA: hypothetical protein ENH80_12260 [Phycisphaerae bacterium]|nr:hypothetical protein [Phycisphaerae bacterium]HDZ44699.1 hypothetical protein [Phycisphaerae bacterium]